MKTLLNKYFKNKTYQFIIHFSIGFWTLGIIFSRLYFIDEHSGYKHFFQKSIHLNIPFFEFGIIYHIKRNKQ